MIWLQGIFCFILWIAYGVLQSRRSRVVRTWARSIPRTRRGLISAGLMLGSMAPIFVVLNLALKYNGFGSFGMTPITWLAVGVFGLLFVHGQTLATALLVTSAYESVTAGRVEASSTHDILKNVETDDHEASSP